MATALLTLKGQSTYTGSTTISNGVLALANNPDNGQDGSIGGSTNIYISSGKFLDVSGRSDDTMPLGSSQILSGNGTVLGILDTTGGGTLAPGDGVVGNTGTLTVTNTANLGGTAWMKLNRANSPNSDRLTVSGSITYGGTLVVTNVGASLHAGDTFTLFSTPTATYNNSFGGVILPNYYTWDTSQLAVNGTITVTAFSPPGLAADFSTFSSGSITLNATNEFAGRPGQHPVSTTNLSSPIATWTVVTTGNFDGLGNFSAPATVDPTVPRQFYVISAQ